MRARTLNIVIAFRAAAFALLRYVCRETSTILAHTVRLSIVVCAMHATLLCSGTKHLRQATPDKDKFPCSLALLLFIIVVV